MLDVILKRFDQPDETRTFAKGKFELVRIGGMTIGRATYDPGWKWSVDVGAPAGSSSARSNTSAWLSPERQSQPWQMDGSSRSKQETSSTLRPAMIAGLSATSRMSLFTSRAPRITPSTTRLEPKKYSRPEGHAPKPSSRLFSAQHSSTTLQAPQKSFAPNPQLRAGKKTGRKPSFGRSSSAQTNRQMEARKSHRTGKHFVLVLRGNSRLVSLNSLRCFSSSIS